MFWNYLKVKTRHETFDGNFGVGKRGAGEILTESNAASTGGPTAKSSITFSEC